MNYDVQFINDWVIWTDQGAKFSFTPFRVYLTICPGPPKCGAKHKVFGLVLFNLGFEIEIETDFQGSQHGEDTGGNALSGGDDSRDEQQPTGTAIRDATGIVSKPPKCSVLGCISKV